MKAVIFFTFLPWLVASMNPREKLSKFRSLGRPFLETYWESYTSFPFNYETCFSHTDPMEVDWTDYAVNLGTIPISESGTGGGVNVVNIAFASAKVEDSPCKSKTYSCDPYICGLNLFQKDNIDSERLEDLKAKISHLQSKGAIVKLAVGGEQWGNPVPTIKTTLHVKILANSLVSSVDLLGLDGIDLVQNQGYGVDNMAANDEASMTLYLASLLREQLPNHILSYTFPSSIDFPYRDVVQYGGDYFDYISLYRATEEHVKWFQDLGVYRSKLVWGVAIGCNPIFDDVTIAQAADIALTVVNGNYGGLMMWSVNRDTDHRNGIGCTAEQTGLPDGSYMQTMSVILQN